MKEIVEPGTVFKQWKVIKEVEPIIYEYKSGNIYKRKFLCECLSCNKNYEVQYNSLKNNSASFCCRRCASGSEILDGKVFKNWKVIKEVEKRGNNRRFLCECLKCNQNYEVQYGNLKNKNNNLACFTCTCGDLSGQRFGRLLVIKKHSQYKNKSWKYKCKCDCGRETIVAGSNLKRSLTVSCGCYNNERRVGENNYNWKGGVTSEYDIKRKREKQTKQLSKQRDSYTCQKCGDNKGGNLESHHIFDFDHYPELQNNIYNFITLCRKCHQRSKKNKHSFHSIYSHIKENTLKDIEDWLGHPFKYRQSLLNYYEYYYKNPSRTRNR